MKIGLYTDSLQDLSFTEALDFAAASGLEAIELGTGNFSSAPHLNVDQVLDDPGAAEAVLAAVAERGLIISALNCNGNLLDAHPQRRRHSQEVYHKTVRAAQKLGLTTVVTMSGCPGDLNSGVYPNWVTCTWQAEYLELLDRQWTEAIEPFWQVAGPFAAAHGVNVAIEMHPGQAVYNTRTLLRLRSVAGPNVGANFDPSHLFWQGMDPLVVLRAFGPGVVFHVHAKDTRLDPAETALNGVLDTRSMGNLAERSWAFRTVGYGHAAGWWRDFISVLRLMGYDGVLSIEHEDRLMGSREGILKSIEFLKPLVLRTAAESWII
jgi:sugar phosphate isomerase/epimerase